MHNELYHYGVIGMKWGVRRTLEELGHKRRARKTQKRRVKALKKARKARLKSAKEKQNLAKKREKYSKDATSMYAHKELFTTEEINKAMERFRSEQALHDLSVRNVNKGREYVQSAVNWTSAGISLYNNAKTINGIINSVKGDDNKGGSPTKAAKEAQKVLNRIGDVPLDQLDITNDMAKVAQINKLEEYAKKTK